MKKLTSFFSPRGVAPGSPSPSPTRDTPSPSSPSQAHISRLPNPVSIVRIRLSVDLSTPSTPVEDDDDIAMASSSDSGSQTQAQLASLPSAAATPRPHHQAEHRQPATMIYLHRSFYRLLWLAFFMVHITTGAHLMLCAVLYANPSPGTNDDAFFFSLLTTIRPGLFP